MLHWRGWVLIGALLFFGLPALAFLGPFSTFLGVGAIVLWASTKFGK